MVNKVIHWSVSTCTLLALCRRLKKLSLPSAHHQMTVSIILADGGCYHTGLTGFPFFSAAIVRAYPVAQRTDTTGSPAFSLKVGRSGTWGIFAKIRKIGKVANFLRRKTDGGSIGLPFDDLFVHQQTHEKAKTASVCKTRNTFHRWSHSRHGCQRYPCGAKTTHAPSDCAADTVHKRTRERRKLFVHAGFFEASGSHLSHGKAQFGPTHRFRNQCRISQNQHRSNGQHSQLRIACTDWFRSCTASGAS